MNAKLEVNTSSWKNAALEYGRDLLQIKVPPCCDILRMRRIVALKDPKDKIENVLSHPMESQTLENIISPHPRDSSKITVAAAVSDNTRPVPYNGEKGMECFYPFVITLP